MLFSSGTFDIVEPSAPTELPLRLANRPDGARTAARALLFVPTLAVMLVPALLALVLLAGVADADQFEHDAVTIAALVAMPVVWSGLALAAALSILPRISRTRVVTVTADHVAALDSGLTGERRWRLPLSHYRGIAHHVRAGTGTVSHEVILVHDDPRRSILLLAAPVVSEASIARLCDQLRLPIVPSREVYRLRWSTPAWPGKPALGSASSGNIAFDQAALLASTAR